MSKPDPVVGDPETLAFQSDPGANRATWIAGILVLALVGWMGSGFIFPSETQAPPLRSTAIAPVAVAVRASQAEPVAQVFRAEGQALPDRETTLRAEASGDVAAVLVTEGADVDQGTVVARLDDTTVQADKARAAQELARAQQDFDNTQSLRERGVATADRLAQTRATLAAAKAQMTAAEEAEERLSIIAAFTGRVEALDLNAGEFVSAGSDVGRLVDITPLTVSIQVPQQSLGRIKTGQTATVRFITGEEREGVVTFVGTSASAETRTFLAKIEVENDDGAIPAGISAEVRIVTDEVLAHFLSPSIVSLNAQGDLGVKTIDQNNFVLFSEVNIVRAQIDGIWVTGLPDLANIITVGQGFVREGDIVAPQSETNAQ